MSRTTAPLQPYLPRLLLPWVCQVPGCRWQELDGSLVFVDISGFTQLSERLAAQGKVGAEELTDAISTCFTRLLGVAYGNGGSLIKFGGDALLLLFQGPDHPAKACRAAIGMRRALRDIGRLQTSGGAVSLRMSVGVHSGTFDVFLVGGSHRELIMTGPGVSETVVMEATADAGQIVVSPATASAVPAGVLGPQKGPGRLLRRAPPGLSPEAPEPQLHLDDGTLVPYIPVAIRDQLSAGLHEPEHRRATVAFIHFDGTDALIGLGGPSLVAGQLEALVCDVQATVDHHGVSFLGTDIDRDGGKIILVAGAPIASENHEERMLLALREIVDGARSVPLRVGVHRGDVFAGDIGPSYRRTYTVMGDTVNLAARLMARAAPSQILATPEVLENSHTLFRATALEPFYVKGKRRPVQALDVGSIAGARHAGSTASLPLVGRTAEMEVLDAATRAAQRGSGRLVQIVGEAGIGKSRLVDELSGRAAIPRYSLSCELYEATTPYAPFGRLLRTLLDMPGNATDQQLTDRLLAVLHDEAPDLLPWAPLLGDALGVELTQTEHTAQLDQQFRRPRLHRTTFQLMSRLLSAPTVLTVEDVHWMDEASSDLLRYFTNQLGEVPWLICVTRRELDGGFIAPEDAHVSTLRLTPLDAEATTALARLATEETPLPPHELLALSDRSGGNPLFLKELIATARAEGGLDALPDSIEALVTTRIDQLPPGDRSALRYVAVLGQTFDRDLAAAVLPEATREDQHRIWERLAQFLAVEGRNVRFRHALIRDAAYEGLPYRLRRQLHATAGETILRDAADDVDGKAELLSFHFFHSQRYPDAWRYSLIAGQRAEALYANVEAAEFFERAFDSGRRVDALPRSELAKVCEALGDVRDRMGAFQEAAAAYRTGRRFLSGDEVADARLMLKLAWEAGWLRRYSQALQWISRGLRALEGLDGGDAARQRADLMVWYARFCQGQGRHTTAIEWCRRAIAEAEASGERGVVAHAYKVLDWAYMELGQADLATYSPRALAIYEELGDLTGQAAVLNNMGGFAYWQGRWDDALECYQRALEVWKRTGDEVGVAFAKSNIGEILSDQGHLETAEELFREALRVWQAAGDRSGTAFGKSNLGRAAARAGRYDEGSRLFHEARAESQDVGAEADVLETDARIAELHVLQGDAEAALSLTAAALERAQRLGGDAAPQSPALHRLRGYALMQLGDLAAAREELEESLQAGRARAAEYEVALTLRALVDLRYRSEGLLLESLEAESRSILERLGVVHVPEVPLPLTTTSH
ncbi:MAG TPA: adenylate/guanylate cyclase domain-containing protein [Nitriliruptorales bacterium]|nr:adenylate/guanylate cyclase domain-containing protein [Nitriliruptorales bacterium]